MKKSFTVKEKLYAMHEITIEGESNDIIELALNSVDERSNIEDYINQLSKQDGILKVEYEQGDVEYDDECEFWDWN